MDGEAPVTVCETDRIYAFLIDSLATPREPIYSIP